MLDGKTVGTLCSKICGMFMMAHLARFPAFETQQEINAAIETMWRRTPAAESASQSARAPIAPSTMLERMEASDTGPDLPQPSTIDFSALGYDPEDTPMEDAAPKVELKTEPKEEPTETAQRPTNTEFRHPDHTMMPDTPMTEAASGTPAPPMADDRDEESRSEEAGNDDLQSGEEQESDPDAVERLEGLSSMFDKITTPRNAEETIIGPTGQARGHPRSLRQRQRSPGQPSRATRPLVLRPRAGPGTFTLRNT